MPTPSVMGGGFTYTLESVGGKWSWKIVSNTILSATQYFYVSDIYTPFGKLSDVDSPIPSDVVSAMWESLNQFIQQLSPTLSVTSSTTLNYTVSEGTGLSEFDGITFTNTGAVGSVMNVAITGSLPWLSASPSSVTGIQKNGVGSTKVRVNSNDLMSTNSPYVGYLSVQNLSNVSQTVPVSVNVNVLPRPTILLSNSRVTFTSNTLFQSHDGPQDLYISNMGPLTSVLNYKVSKAQNSSPWLKVTPTAGGALGSGIQETVTLSLVSQCLPIIPGEYTETLVFTSVNATNTPQVVVVNLIVT